MVRDWGMPGLWTDVNLGKAQTSGFEALARQVQGLLLNVFWAEELEVEIPEDRLDEVELRSAAAMLQRILELDGSPLEVARPPHRRLVANARGFAVLYAALLREQGVPVRVRCGFSTSFRRGLYLEHWLCEVWHAAEQRWLLVDPGLDEVQRTALGVSFNAVDVPRDRFVLAGEAWQLCAADDADPDIFGLYEYTGMWFIRGSLVRDLLALAKIELLPWDSFGLIAKEEDELTAEDLDLLDCLAEFTQQDDISFAELLAVVEHNPCLQPPEACC